METSGGTQPVATGSAAALAERAYLRAELERRRQRLQVALKSSSAPPDLSALLEEVDGALSRMEHGTYGVCEVCHDPIERERLLADPLVRFCLDDLSGDERQALENDLTLAAEIQRGFLPPQETMTANWQVYYHYQPARVVSGDYCDYFTSNGDLLFLCGDVAGKGVAASMLMSHLHATFRSLADAKLSLGRLVQAANRLFLESTMVGQYATLVVGRAADDGCVELINAGHLPVLHLGASGANARESTGVPLGMFSNAQFDVHHLQLLPGDGLLIYTDGVTETRDAQGEEYGMQRVKNLAAKQRGLEPGPLVKSCLEDLGRFRCEGKQTDDVTVMALRRGGVSSGVSGAPC